eukprot:m.384648 g.384648  ORF g.384648 m.384648 type:complete len:148 (-) comp20998_c0_seq2:489-932(-)
MGFGTAGLNLLLMKDARILDFNFSFSADFWENSHIAIETNGISRRLMQRYQKSINGCWPPIIMKNVACVGIWTASMALHAAAFQDNVKSEQTFLYDTPVSMAEINQKRFDLHTIWEPPSPPSSPLPANTSHGAADMSQDTTDNVGRT